MGLIGFNVFLHFSSKGGPLMKSRFCMRCWLICILYLGDEFEGISGGSLISKIQIRVVTKALKILVTDFLGSKIGLAFAIERI